MRDSQETFTEIQNTMERLSQEGNNPRYSVALTHLYRIGKNLIKDYEAELKNQSLESRDESPLVECSDKQILIESCEKFPSDSQPEIVSLKENEQFRRFIEQYRRDNKISPEPRNEAEKLNEYEKQLKILQALHPLVAAWEEEGFFANPNFLSVEQCLENHSRYSNTRLIEEKYKQAIYLGLFVLCGPEKALPTDIPNNKNLNQSIVEKIDQIIKKYPNLSELVFTEREWDKNFDNAVKAISRFSSRTKKNRAIKITSILLALVIGVTAGLATGGAIYLLLPQIALWLSLPAPSVGLVYACSVLLFIAGFGSNYSFFSEDLPEFFQMVSRGEFAKSIDKATGKWTEMSSLKKYVLLPLASFFSLSVGIVSAALLVGWIIDFSATTFPLLASSVPLLLGGILGIIYGIGLTVVMLHAFVKALKDPISLTQIKDWLVGLKASQIPGYLIKGILTSLVLFGIGFGCKVSVGTLVTLLSVAFPHIALPIISAICIGLAVVSFIGQVPFAVISVNKFCDVTAHFFVKLFKPSPSSVQGQEDYPVQKQADSTVFSKLKSGLSTLFRYGALILNALGNAILVFIKGSISSVVAATGAGLYSFAGNMPGSEYNSARNEALLTTKIKGKHCYMQEFASTPVLKDADLKQEGLDPNSSQHIKPKSNGVAYFDNKNKAAASSEGFSRSSVLDENNEVNTVSYGLG